MALSPQDKHEPRATTLLVAAAALVAASAVVPVILYATANRDSRATPVASAAVRAEPPAASALPAAHDDAADAGPVVVADAGVMAVASAKSTEADGPGFLTIHTTPHARVSEHGRVLCTATPCARLALAPGAHSITLENKEEGMRNTITITIASGETTSKRITLKP